MKILQVTFNFSPDVNNEGLIQYNMSRELLKRGHDVKIVAFSDHKELLRKQIDGIDVYYLPKLFNFYYLPVPNPIYFKFLKNLIRKVDIVHCHHYFNFISYYVCKIAKKEGIKTVLTPHSLELSNRNFCNVLLKSIYDMIIGKRMIQEFDIIHALTLYDIEILQKMGIDQKNIRIIPNGINLDKFVHISSESFKKRYKLENNRVVLYVGRLHKAKYIQYLLEGGVTIKNNFPDVKFLIVGPDYGYMRELVKLVKELNIENYVIFTGPLRWDQVLEAYSCADVFVLPSAHECFGVTILEAMASGLPIIATKVDAIPYIIENGKTGLLVDPMDPKQLSSAIIQLLSDPLTANELGRAGKETVISYDWKFIVDKIENIYSELIKRGGI